MECGICRSEPNHNHHDRNAVMYGNLKLEYELNSGFSLANLEPEGGEPLDRGDVIFGQRLPFPDERWIVLGSRPLEEFGRTGSATL